MSEADQGSAQAGNPDGSATTAAVAPDGSGNGGDWWAGLQDEGNRKLVEAKGWNGKPLDEAIKSYSELESRLGKALVLPKEDAKPEDWAAFYRKLGSPEKPDGYEFRMPDGLPENLPYDANSAGEFKLWAHEAGLTPQQAQKVHDAYVKKTASLMQARQDAEDAAAKAGHDTLVKEWGDPESEGFKRSHEFANRALRMNDKDGALTAELKSIGALASDGSVKAPQLANLLKIMGEKLYAEDALYGGPAGNVNPFADGSENITEQGRIFRADPERARALILQAGKKDMFSHLFSK